MISEDRAVYNLVQDLTARIKHRGWLPRARRPRGFACRSRGEPGTLDPQPQTAWAVGFGPSSPTSTLP